MRGIRFAWEYTSLGVVALLLFCCISIWCAVVAYAQSGILKFAVLDVGQGDSLYIEGPTGLQVLIDAGPDDGSVLKALPTIMPWYDHSLDAVIATHPDADHVGGFIDLLKRYSVGMYLEPGIRDDSNIDATVESEVTEKNIPRYFARRGEWIDIGGGARLQILYPDTDVSAYSKKTNDGSIVAHVVYGNTSILLTGDMPKNIEEYVMQIANSSELASDILKVGHHGSKYSTSDAFMKEVSPKIAVISVGAHNTYGHPAQVVLDEFAADGVEVVRTDKEGTIVFASDGEHFTRIR